MSYPIDVFQKLSQQPWSSLEQYITSPEGGNYRIVGSERYRILRYVKGISDLSQPYGKWMRSVIWDTQTNRPVCVAPPKAEKENFETGDHCPYPVIQEFLDGIMINAFVTEEEPDKLQLATRSQLGAGGKFYSSKTFAEMFEEVGCSIQLGKPTKEKPAYFVSFVLQHPEHRVVARIHKPRICIVHTGYVEQDGKVWIDERIEGAYALPKVTIPASSTLEEVFKAGCESSWYFQGFTIKDGQGKRWRMRNPHYLQLRSLRGSEALPVDRFIRLRQEGKVSEYLKHYSEDRQHFWNFEQLLRSKTQEAFQAYCSVHKAHEKKLGDIASPLQPCVFKLHSHYLEHLRPNNEKVQMKHAVDIVNNLPLYEQKRLLTSASG